MKNGEIRKRLGTIINLRINRSIQNINFFMKFYYFPFFILLGCQNSALDKKESRNDSFQIKAVAKENVENKKMSMNDTAGFFSNCQHWTYGLFMGNLQGVNASKDSLGAFCFYECYDCKETFRIIFIHKSKSANNTNKAVWSEFENGCNEKYPNFNCFAFVYPMRDPDKQKDVHAMNIDFPVIVKTYERMADDNWRFIKQVKAETFKELALLQFRTIYHLN